ncbi:hypothetical protein BASA50_002715 [Batrachochytrium salamandrivorans]|uniref:Uncharacterized protein n=1 Tax=Batrachochytrium salamandrivorans TaxID=1357716 RepID=A0ABQ8FKE9_9FUNG|nr:hypothetical protein BASA62_006496 [Batrachochytrium salamandrivorans]KAH6573549.1 hypothetical protein BASA60_005964 [Batrachochytrium salamandrivorans]KAH6599844.1 hypothetical protein BASA50_002715 [Batrachochytrium salamandrivorans]KAH9246085.1 hypothetical protein BASA81_016392 [Batrachochytrium salamandrivorans]KAH9248916.1 hypothetical protein BASA81_013428 [Batrachochytrium salamandrivorans]
MQFFHLVSFVVVASYAAAFPQPAELSKRHSNNADFALASGLGARSYQPGFNSQKGSVTLVSLERRGDSEGSSGGNSGSDSSPPPETTHEPIEVNTSDLLGESEFAAMALVSVVSGFGTGLGDVPESATAVGAAIGGSTGNLLVEYLRSALYATDYLVAWIGYNKVNLFATIKAGLSDKEYAEVEPSLKKTGEKVAADASVDLKKVTDALLAIEQKPALAKPKFDVIHAAFERVLESHRMYFDMILTQLERFELGKIINAYFYFGISRTAKFIRSQKEVYSNIRKELKNTKSKY